MTLKGYLIMSKKLKDIIAAVLRNYTHAGIRGFLYNHPNELKIKSDVIGVLVLLYDENTGFKKHTYVFKRQKWNYKQWEEFIYNDTIKTNFVNKNGEKITYEGGLKIIAEQILPARNELMDEDLRLVSVIGWSFDMGRNNEKYH